MFKQTVLGIVTGALKEQEPEILEPSSPNPKAHTPKP